VNYLGFCKTGTLARAGIGIPMATDLVFVPGTLALFGNRIPALSFFANPVTASIEIDCVR
jgi:Na+/H+ antiporter NhaA